MICVRLSWSNVIKSYHGKELSFDGPGSRSLGNGFARNVVIFGVGSSLQRHFENVNNNVLVSGKRPIDDIYDSTDQPKKGQYQL